MKHPERVENYLEHILEATTRALDYLQRTDNFRSFELDQLTQDAVVRNIEILGEAATQIQKAWPSFIENHPEIPWSKMRGMRNLVIHRYFSLDLEIVWRTVKDSLPPLKRQINALLEEHRRAGNP